MSLRACLKKNLGEKGEKWLGQVRKGEFFFEKSKKTWRNGEFLRKIEGKRQNLGEKGKKWLG